MVLVDYRKGGLHMRIGYSRITRAPGAKFYCVGRANIPAGRPYYYVLTRSFIRAVYIAVRDYITAPRI
jgi:hypothetical protein